MARRFGPRRNLYRTAPRPPEYPLPRQLSLRLTQFIRPRHPDLSHRGLHEAEYPHRGQRCRE